MMAWSLAETKFVVLDTETTGLSPAEDRVVDIALVQVQNGTITELYSSLVNPQRPIPPEASAVHHLTDKHVADAPMIDEVKSVVLPLLEDAVIVAHNAPFDSSMFPVKRPWLCTLRLAKHLWPEAKYHSNQYLRYWQGIEVGDVSVHRAAGDAFVTAHLLVALLEEYLRQGGSDDVRDLWKFTQAPIMVQKMPFGKHKGVPMSEVPTDYLEWLRGRDNLSPDLLGTIETLLKQREGA